MTDRRALVTWSGHQWFVDDVRGDELVLTRFVDDEGAGWTTMLAPVSGVTYAQDLSSQAGDADVDLALLW